MMPGNRPMILVAVLASIVSSGCNCSPTSPIPDDDGGEQLPDGGGEVPTDGGSNDGGGEVPTDGGSLDGGTSALGCPAYQKLCGDRCVAITVDPSNCGECGTVCTGTSACSGGSCASSCMGNLSICANRCVDLKTDNLHCGACNNSCGPGKGCVDGSCVTSLGGARPAGECVNGGPPILVDRGSGDPGQCSGDLAQTTFRWALCSCSNIGLTNPLLTDAFNSALAPYAPGGLGGGVGLNGAYSSSGQATIHGALWASADGGVTTGNPTAVYQELHVGGPLTANNPFTVSEDAFVAGNLSTPNSISIGKTLRVPPGATLSGNITYQSLSREPVSVPEPCECSASQLIPVASIVSARATANDNARISLSSAAASNVTTPTRIDLACGHYYLDSISASAPLAIVAHGRTALYVGGDVTTGGVLTITLAPASELDLFIAGNLVVTSPLNVGSPNYPALTRLYLGGTGTMSFSNDVRIAGYLYAARSRLTFSNPLDAFGGVYAGDFSSSNVVNIHFDRQVLKAAASCPAAGREGCSSCKDCGNQACVNNACGRCTDSSQCCAPLICVKSTGTCEVVLQ